MSSNRITTKRKLRTITCAVCKKVIKTRSFVQKYCSCCSNAKSLVTKKLTKPASKKPTAVKPISLELSKKNTQSIAWDTRRSFLLWHVRIAVPFTYATSKNAIYTNTRWGHRALRATSKQVRDSITQKMKDAVKGLKIAHNKVWIDILVQKSNHRGDAINVIDLVCDAIKLAIPVDDRWFCIRVLDWEIAKTDPKIYIGIGQDTNKDAQVCSHCGRILGVPAFNKDRTKPLGISRECKRCTRGMAEIRRAKHKSQGNIYNRLKLSGKKKKATPKKRVTFKKKG